MFVHLVPSFPIASVPANGIKQGVRASAISILLKGDKITAINKYNGLPIKPRKIAKKENKRKSNELMKI